MICSKVNLWFDNIFLQLNSGQNIFEGPTFTQREKINLKQKRKIKEHYQYIAAATLLVFEIFHYFAGIVVMWFSKISTKEINSRNHNLIQVNTDKFIYFGSWKSII